MRLLIPIAAASLLVAACSPPDDDDRVVIDTSVVDSSTAPDMSSDAAAEPLLEGGLLAETDGEDVQIYDAGEFLFVVVDQRTLGWLPKTGGFILEFGSWPDQTRPDDGPPSRDTDWDDEYFYFLTESAPGEWSIAGVEHFLGSASPLFGQPIIVIDVGPSQASGFSRFADLFAVPSIDELIVLTEAGINERIPLGGRPVFDRMEQDWLFVEATDGFQLRRYGPNSAQLTTYESMTQRPMAYAASSDAVYFIDAAGQLRSDNSETTDDAVPLADAAPTANPVLAAGAAGAAWTSEGEVRAHNGTVHRFEAADVDSIVIDATHVYWGGADGIFAAELP